MAYGTVSADVIQSSVAGSNLGAGNASIMKNRIINGAMVIDQRNAGASVTPSNSYTLDRWSTNTSQASKFTVQQVSTAPVGFINSLKVTSSSAYSVGAGDVFTIYQSIEGFNILDLAWGTASAKTVTLSFQVYSSLTGTFGGAFANSAGDRSYPFTYTISSANTWTTISVTVAGDTSGTWLTTNGIGIQVRFGLGAGSTYSSTAGSWQAGNYFSATGATSVVGTSGATFYITGVQLEVGSSATGYEYRQYGQELALCQRYAFISSASAAGDFGSGVATGTGGQTTFSLPVSMRAVPAVTYSAAGNFLVADGSAGYTGTAISLQNATQTQISTSLTTAANTVGRGIIFRWNTGTAFILASAEL